METKKIYCSISHDQHAYFLAARIFHPGKRDKAICAFIDEVRRIIGNIVYDEDKKTVGEYLRQLARDLNASHKSSFDIFIEPLKKNHRQQWYGMRMLRVHGCK